MGNVRRCLLPVALALTVAAPSAVGISYLRDAFREPLTAEGFVGGSPMLVPGIRTPPTVAANQCNLSDDELVIGIHIGDTPRAYRLDALAPIMCHVVNDVIEEQPVTVTYCNRDGCVRVFTADGAEPLPISTGG